MNPNAGTETGSGDNGSRGCFKLSRQKRNGITLYDCKEEIVVFGDLIWFPM